jgi:heat shock protein HslJ
MKIRTVVSLLIAALFPVSMAAAGTVNLAGTEWGFTDDASKAPRFVQFRSDGRLAGYSGCNRFTGSFTQDGNTLTMGPLATTRMACPPEAMKREQQFLALLGKVRYAEGTGLKLTLKDADDNVLAELIRRDPD